VTTVPAGSKLSVFIYYDHYEPIKDAYFGLLFETAAGMRIFWVQTRLQKGPLPDLPASGVIACYIPRLPLTAGTYFLQPGCGTGTTQLDVVPRACQLHIIEADVFGTGRLPHPLLALVLVDADWEVLPEAEDVEQ
jgi:Wzt-like putative exopolysaccharide export protein